ncbi:uncharacterized protein LOC120420710 [Culex pipiens pallens]|uniref:uncharacterized protein LOC120420710 n=1 Tax=Culex pipiens pallens TaxID=42434 RepID=UPI001952ACF6|nr:uncharacterized protein LOC120420710 [Culex pipiens pallens]XP_039439739.1 uncharacterized protein LOC120420710 [Culex pipiens pallens]
MGAKMSRRSGRKAAAAVNVASTVGELATPDETRPDETDVDRVAGGGRVNGGNASTGGIPEPDPPVSEQKLTDSCFGQSDEPADPVPEGPMVNDILSNDFLDITTAVPIPEPLVDPNFPLTILTVSGTIQGQNETVSLVPVPDPPVEEQILTDDVLIDLERPVDPVPESPETNAAPLSEPSAAASSSEPPAEPNACEINFPFSETLEGVPEPENSKKNVNFSDFVLVYEYAVWDFSNPTVYSVLVKDPVETVPELPPLNSNQIKYFWCHSCQNYGRNTLPWLLRLKYSKFAMWLRHLFCASMCCAVIGLIVFV